MAEKLRIDKLLAHMGYGTRSEIKKAVKQGKVTVDGKAVKDSGLIVDPAVQTVAYEGETVVYRDVIYLMLNKPAGVISATEDGRDRTVIDLLEPEDRLLNPFPVGRLDKDTVGLLLLTNDGQLAHELLSPRKHVDKTYEAWVLGDVGDADASAFRSGVELDDGYVTMPADLAVLEKRQADEAEGMKSLIRLTIREGKFHQVKRMFEAVGKKVLTLKRISMGPLTLDEQLAQGEYRELTEEEVELLRAHRGKER
ncbi:rRNA pseudouridine synthase [Paenibacillus nanensis]|uniref:Pseudouridine synthase n=1 Tax=Paenibacillus nanensis TaxID=393251 RepID=A0A3A1V2V4_9BACL|nr:pseudouridine synthase [Paenibacillus nanensis]RIX54086.1 rRNA pseudouridine synthase [Paenibacillus nanensis]